MKLKRFLIRYHPPAIILEFTRSTGEVDSKVVELFNLNQGLNCFIMVRTDLEKLADKIINQEPLIS